MACSSKVPTIDVVAERDTDELSIEANIDLSKFLFAKAVSYGKLFHIHIPFALNISLIHLSFNS
ncbi:hypothetical protein oki361_26020 [Helicobacter pylori]